MLNTGADPIQEMTLLILLGCIVALTNLARAQWRLYWGLYVPILAVFIHAITFYTCIVFANWDFFSFTHWSRWLRLHEVGTALLIMIALIIRRKIYNQHTRGNYGC
jgi:hypothetical protein